jgi:hypothetical protein
MFLHYNIGAAVDDEDLKVKGVNGLNSLRKGNAV